MASENQMSQVESDLDRARERLSFYEHFDEIIKQNIASSSALLREASARFDADTTEERQAWRLLLSNVLDEISALQRAGGTALAIELGTSDPDEWRAEAERFARDVLPRI